MLQCMKPNPAERIVSKKGLDRAVSTKISYLVSNELDTPQYAKAVREDAEKGPQDAEAGIKGIRDDFSAKQAWQSSKSALMKRATTQGSESRKTLKQTTPPNTRTT